MSKRQELRAKRAQQERTQRILIIAGVTIIAIAFALILILPQLTPVGDIAEHPAINRPQVKFNAMGDPNAPVKIIEYSDFQCPYCGMFALETEPLLINAYIATGKVYFEYRSFGDFIGTESFRAAEAAYCAGDQEKFWEMHDVIYANQTGENVGAYTDQRLIAFAKKISLDMVAFNDCFTNGKYADKVTQDGQNAIKDGIKATPSFLINGKLIEGAQPFSAFQTEIDALLK